MVILIARPVVSLDPWSNMHPCIPCLYGIQVLQTLCVHPWRPARQRPSSVEIMGRDDLAMSTEAHSVPGHIQSRSVRWTLMRRSFEERQRRRGSKSCTGRISQRTGRRGREPGYSSARLTSDHSIAIREGERVQLQGMYNVHQ